jgi:hypothetical protein
MEWRTVSFGIAPVLLLIIVSAAAAQTNEPGSRDRVPGKGDSIRVKGCLDGPTLQSIETSMTDDTGQLATALTYQLRGDKKLVKHLREEHDGTVVIVTGILKSDLPQQGGIRSKRAGKTRITIGVGTPSTQRGGVDSSTALPVLEIKSYEGYGTRCIR